MLQEAYLTAFANLEAGLPQVLPLPLFLQEIHIRKDVIGTMGGVHYGLISMEYTLSVLALKIAELYVKYRVL